MRRKSIDVKHDLVSTTRSYSKVLPIALSAGLMLLAAPGLGSAQDDQSREEMRERLEQIERQQKELESENLELRLDLQRLERQQEEAKAAAGGDVVSQQSEQSSQRKTFTIQIFDKHEVEWWP